MEILIILIIVALIFDFMNGFNDSANIVATMISSRAFSPRTAVLIAAIAEFAGPFILGTAVARTIGSGIIDQSVMSMRIILAAMAGAITWNIIAWIFGTPSSSSHGLVGGLIGAVAFSFGFDKINSSGLTKVLIILFTSPVIGFLAGLIFAKALYRFTEMATPRINAIFKKSQFFTAGFLALSHGGNDAQKTMGIITMGLIILQPQKIFVVPFWVIIICAFSLALGISFGGARIVKTVGYKIFRIRPIHGFAVQACSSIVILTAALIGGPVSTTHIVGSTVVGVGSADRPNRVRWGVVWDILKAWVLTIPAAALMAAVFYRLFSFISN